MDEIYILPASGTQRKLAGTDMPGSMSYHKLSMRLNEAGTMEIHCPVTNTAQQNLSPLDEIVFKRNGIELWRGELSGNIQDMINTGEITVSGALGYLANVYMEPYEYDGTVEGYVSLLLNTYNSRVPNNRKIQVGSITITDTNNRIIRSDTERKRILDIITSKIINQLGGYARIRVVNNTRYLDILAEFEGTAGQTIEYSKNILDIKQEVQYGEVYTVIIPLGAEDEETGEKITIASVNNGNIYYADSTAVSRYGWRELVVEWEDVTLPENLLTKCKAKLAEMVNPIKSVTVKAVDLSIANASLDCFHIGDNIRCTSSYHGLAETYLLSQMEIYSLHPEKEILILGGIKSKFTETQSDRLTYLEDQTAGLKKDNWNLAQRIQDADGLFTTVVEDAETGSQKIYLHDQKRLSDSQLQISFSTVGIFLSADGGQTWYGMEMDGDAIVHILQAYGISADIIEGGRLESIDKNADGTPITWINCNNGTFSLANGAISFDGKTFVNKQQAATEQKIVELENKVNGIDGTYFYIRYSANANGNPMTVEPTDTTKYMGTCSTSSEAAPNNPADYTWVKIGGKDGAPGTPGSDGRTSYLHVKYSNDGKTFTGNLVTTDYDMWQRGYYNNSSNLDTEAPNASTSSLYYISLADAVPITPGKTYKVSSGHSTIRIGYTKYNSSGTGVSSTYVANGVITMPTDCAYARWYLRTDSTSGVIRTFEDWKTLFDSGAIVPDVRPADEVPGEEIGSWFGTLVDFTEKDSELFSSYTWKKFTAEIDEELEDLKRQIVEQTTTMTQTAESIVQEALTAYVTEEDYGKKIEEIESRIEQTSSDVKVSFEERIKTIETSNESTEEAISKITKWFSFNINGLQIGSDESPFTILIDNDRLSFSVDGTEVLVLDPETRQVNTARIAATESLHVAGFEAVLDAEGRLTWDYVGEVTYTGYESDET